MDHFSPETSSVSFIIEQDIPPEKTDDFLKWQAEIIEASRQFKGFLRTENFPPSSNTRPKWYTVIHFDTPENLTQWLDSEVRHQFIRTRPDKLGFYRFYSYKTGFEAWLSKQKNLPKWKQGLSVLFGLYPTVMLESILFSHWPITESWSFATIILLNNLISCLILTWLVMPLVTRLFQFWLKPQKPSLQIDYLGALLIIFGLGLMVSFFTTFI